MKKITKKILLIFLCAVSAHAILAQSTKKAIYYFNPQWSPDGSSIVFESTRDGKSSIYTIAPDGSGLTRITDTTFNYGQPTWSPDGKQLVYYGSSRPMQLFINSVKGGEQKQLSTPGYDAYEPVWSSQNILAFDSRAIGQTPNDIAIMNADGTGFTKLNNVGHNNPSIWLLILEYLIAPSIIIFISVWLTNYSNKSKEYNRIKKLSDFVTTWLNKIEEGISEQINLLKALQNTYKNIDFNSQRDFSYSVADIKSVIELPKTDLHKLFISIRTGSEIEKNENFYNLLLALNSAYESIYDYKLKTPELAKNVNEISDEGADAFKHLRVGEASYVNYHLQKAQQNPIYITSPALQIATEYSRIAQARHTYLATPIGNTRIKKGLYFYCKKQLAFCENNLPSDQNLLPLIELNRLVKESIVYYTEYYKNIRNALETKINGLGRIKLEITERKNYFVNLPFISKSSFRE